MMITAIANKGGKISPVYEEADSFSIVTGSGTDLSVADMLADHSQGQAVMAGQLKSRGVLRVLAADIGEAALQALETAGIQVFYGAAGTISDGLNLISLGILDSMAGGCGSGCSSSGCGGCNSDKSSGCGSGCGCS